jgi:hypothetical protein
MSILDTNFYLLELDKKYYKVDSGKRLFRLLLSHELENVDKKKLIRLDGDIEWKIVEKDYNNYEQQYNILQSSFNDKKSKERVFVEKLKDIFELYVKHSARSAKKVDKLHQIIEQNILECFDSSYSIKLEFK